MGDDFNVYLFRYYYEGSWWSLEIPATSPEDAEARLQKLPQAQYLGKGIVRIPARVGPLTAFLRWALKRIVAP